jgi:uncharacterized protein (TIGR03435 family)
MVAGRNALRLRRIGIILTATAGLAGSQAPAPPEFEVASVKASGPKSIRGSEGGPGSSDPGRYRFSAASLLDLIVTAYNVQPFRISSPAPLDRRLFDLVAKVPEGTTKPQFRTMLQNLLAERFALKLHIESKEFPAYELVVAKTGTRLKEGVEAGAPHRPGDGFPELPANRPGMIANNSVSGSFLLVRLRSQQEPISEFVSMLRPTDGLPVVDRTELSGKYDFTLEYTEEPPNVAAESVADPPVAPNLFTALQQQLGVQLVRRKVPFDVLVIESFNQLPAEN